MGKRFALILVCFAAAVSLSTCSDGNDSPAGIYINPLNGNDSPAGNNINPLIGVWFQAATASSSDQTLILTAATWENDDAGNGGCIEAGTYAHANTRLTFTYGPAGGCHAETPGSTIEVDYDVNETTLGLYDPNSAVLIQEYTKQSGTAPVADAGFTQTVPAGTFVTLDGSASAAVDGAPLTYSWSETSKPGGSMATLSSTTAASPSFTADIAGAYVLSLVVSDGTAGSTPNQVTITGTPISPPVLETPYVNEGDMQNVRNLFIATPGLPPPYDWIHDGLDIYPNGDLKSFQAACSGKVYWVLALDDVVNVQLKCNSAYMIEYGFEPQSAGTGTTQLAHMAVVAGQAVSRGDPIGDLYVADPNAHVHFSMMQNSVNVCPEPYFSTAARGSVLNVVHSNPTYSTSNMCYGDTVPNTLVTPYVNESDMAAIRKGFSSDGSASPWGGSHDGFDIYPNGDGKELRSVCSGTVSSVTKRQDAESNWEVEVLMECEKVVPNTTGYFTPFWPRYLFRPMSIDPASGNTQETRITVSAGQPVAQGDVIGTLYAATPEAHVHFGVSLYADPALAAMGVPNLPICPDRNFEPAARTSMLNLIHNSWPGAILCYQN